MSQTLPVGVTGVIRSLRAAVAMVGPDALPDLVRRAAAAVGAVDVVIYLADYPQVHLVPLPAGSGAGQLIDATLAGRAYVTLEVQHAPERPDRLWIPLVDGCERLGVV